MSDYLKCMNMYVMHIKQSILAFLWFVSFIFFLLRVWHVCRNRRTLRFGGSEKLMAIANCKTKMLYAARPSQFHIWRRRWACGISMRVTKIYCKDGSYKSRSKIYFVFFYYWLIVWMSVITSSAPWLHRHR